MHTSSQSRISPTVLSSALIAFSGLWFVAGYVFHVTNRGSKDGVSAAPLWTMLLLVLIPLSALVVGPWLVRARRVEGERLRPLDYCALVAAFVPLAIIGFVVFLGILWDFVG